MITLLQISWRMWQWQNFEDRPLFDEVMCRLRRLTFLAHPVRWDLKWKIALFQPYRWICQWNKFENRSIYRKDI